jgi:hypothetical protein
MSDDYTPSMENVRRIYAGRMDPKNMGAEFDRAIAAHDAELRAEIAAEIRAEAKKRYMDAFDAATVAEGKA